MTLSQLETQLQSGTPTELYQIQPGQITYFVPKNSFGIGCSARAIDIITFIARFTDDKDIKLDIVSTENEVLIGNFAGRNARETNVPYNIVVGPYETLVGLTAEYLGLDIDYVKKNGKKPDNYGDMVMEDELPVIISLNPEDCPAKKQHNEATQFTCPYMNGGVGGMEALVAEDRQPSKDKLQNQIGELLSKCEKYGYDIDVIGLKDRIKESYRQAQEYQLKLDLQYKTRRKGYCQSDVLGVCDIYIIGDGVEHKLDIRPAEKALYLTTILQGGFYLADISFSFLEDMAAIFSLIPDHQEKEDGIKAQNQSSSGIGVMKMRIRNAIISAIGSGPAVDEFAIEGYRGQEVSVRKATKAHIAQIKEYFGLK